jgi:hypothetical protein
MREIGEALVIWEKKQSAIDACEPDVAKLSIASPRFSLSFGDRDPSEQCKKERRYLEHILFPISDAMYFRRWPHHGYFGGATERLVLNQNQCWVSNVGRSPVATA